MYIKCSSHPITPPHALLSLDRSLIEHLGGAGARPIALRNRYESCKTQYCIRTEDLGQGQGLWKLQRYIDNHRYNWSTLKKDIIF